MFQTLNLIAPSSGAWPQLSPRPACFHTKNRNTQALRNLVGRPPITKDSGSLQIQDRTDRVW